MSKLTLTDLANLQNETTAVSAINGNNTLVENALENTLSRDGTSPNTMNAALDMNSHRILNLPTPSASTDPVRLGDISSGADGLAVATQAEAEAGTSNSVLMTPLRTVQEMQALGGAINAALPPYSVVAGGSTSQNTGIAAAIAAAVAAGGRMRVILPKGVIYLTSQISIASDNVILEGQGRAETILLQNTLTANGIIVSGNNCGIKGLSVIYASAASAGNAFIATGTGLLLEDVWADKAYVGYTLKGSSLIAERIRSTNHVYSGLWLESLIDAEISDVYLNAGTTANASLGNVRLYKNAEAIQISNLVALSGKYGMTVDTDSDTYGARPAWCAFSNFIIDGSARGSSINSMHGSSFTNCWFAASSDSGAYDGVTFASCKHLTIEGCRLFNCRQNGGYIRNTCEDIRVIGGSADSNSLNTSNTYHGWKVEANTNYFSFIGVSGGNTSTPGGAQAYNIYIEAGTSDYYTIIAADGAALTGNVFDGGTGVNKNVIVDGAYKAKTLSLTSQLTSTLATGTAPFVVASTTRVSNLNVAAAALADTVTTNANLTGPITSSGNATAVASQTGTGTKFVMDTSPTLVTPVLGVATGTSFNGLTITSTTGTFTLTNGKTLSVSNTLTFTGTDSSSVAFGAGGTVSYTSDKLSAHAATTSAELKGVISDETGSGALVFANTPSLVTPDIGAATGTSLTTSGAIKCGTATSFSPGTQATTDYATYGFSNGNGPSFLVWGSAAAGAGQLEIYSGGSARMTFKSNGDRVPGTAALATNATTGFGFIDTCAGTPTGAPTTYTGRVAMVYDTTNHKIYVYDGGWKATAALT